MAKETAKDRLLKRMKKGLSKDTGDYENKSIFKSGLELNFWKVAEGKQHWFDIIPYKAGKNDPDADEGEDTYCFQPYVHKNVGPSERDVICLAKTYGKKCAICEYVKELISKGADEEEYKPLQVQRNPRAIYNVAVLGSKEDIKKGVQIFNASHYTIEGPLLELASRPTRPGQEGIDPFVYYASPDKEGKTICFKRKDSFNFVAHSFENRDYEISKKLLAAAHTLDDLVVIPTYKEQEEWLFGDATKDEDEDEPEVRSGRPVPDEVEEEEEEETGGTFDGMDRSDLKNYIKKNKLGIRVKPKMTEKDIIKAIMEVEKEPAEEEEEDSGDCPKGHVFGKDFDAKDDCEECDDDKWKDCAKANEELNE